MRLRPMRTAQCKTKPYGIKFQKNSGQIDGVLVKNQPGSSMKPFLYALAIDKDLLTPASIIADVPSEFGSEKLYSYQQL